MLPDSNCQRPEKEKNRNKQSDSKTWSYNKQSDVGTNITSFTLHVPSYALLYSLKTMSLTSLMRSWLISSSVYFSNIFRWTSKCSRFFIAYTPLSLIMLKKEKEKGKNRKQWDYKHKQNPHDLYKSKDYISITYLSDCWGTVPKKTWNACKP